MAKIENSLGQNIISGNSIWGDITGNVQDQSDLINFLDLNFYPLNSNPESYLTLDTLPDVSFAELTGKPTTLSGYGITDAYPLLGNPSNFLITETDPLFTASPAGSISNTDKTNWNTSFGWGNHALVGYLTSETDPVFLSWLNNNDNEPKFVVKNKYIVVPLFGNASPQTLAGISYSINGATTRNFSDTNLYTRTPSLGLLTTAVAGNVAQARQVSSYFSLNSGFDVYIKFGSNENANLSGIRSFVGISNSNGVQSNVEPNTLLNSIGFCRLSTSDNWHLIHNNNAGVAVTVDLGSNFPANTSATDLYLARIRSLSSTSVEITTYRLNTTDVDVRIISTELPSSSTPLCLRWWITNNTNASIVGMDFMGSYVTN